MRQRTHDIRFGCSSLKFKLLGFPEERQAKRKITEQMQWKLFRFYMV